VRLTSRLTALLAALALAVAVVLTIFWGRLQDRAAERQAQERMRAEDALLVELAAPMFDRPAELDRLVRESAARLGLRITAIDASGRVLSDSDLDEAGVAGMDNHSTRPEIARARLHGTGSSERHSATLERNFLYLAERVDRDGRNIGFLRLAAPIDDLRAGDAATNWAGRAAIAAACLALFAVGALGSRRLSSPIQRVADAAMAVSRGDLAREIPEEDEPEAASLSDAVRRMKQSLLSSVEEVRSQQRLTAAVFDRLPSGLVVVGDRGEIASANRAFRRIFDCPDAPGRPLVDIVRDASVNRLFEDARTSGVDRWTTWKRADETTWEVSALPLIERGTKRIVGIFRDVSPIARNEEMRRRFVSDVSHELRTPVASIAAAAETLADGSGESPEESGALLALIRRQIGRMQGLIDDLTDLSRIESGAVDLHLEDVAVLPIAREAAADAEARATFSEVTIEVSGDANARISGDRRRLSQILENLLDNAVKFSPPGGTVRVSVASGDDGVALSVSDEGPGVPASEREKIFQRFYQVDPSRSKVRPGTGLGLAIVKHLVLLHKAAIRVGGEAGAGATFTIFFPALARSSGLSGGGRATSSSEASSGSRGPDPGRR
jgi:two-component system phosphate regulon sensor histidine kinase PhoR